MTLSTLYPFPHNFLFPPSILPFLLCLLAFLIELSLCCPVFVWSWSGACPGVCSVYQESHHKRKLALPILAAINAKAPQLVPVLDILTVG